jgi:hypothetical protein
VTNKPGLSFESAASVIAREHIAKYLEVFGPAIMSDRVAGKSVHAEYVNGLAGVCALLIAGGQASKEDVLNGTIAKLREYVDRDLQHLNRGRLQS